MSVWESLVPDTDGWMGEAEIAHMLLTAYALPADMGGLLEVGCFKGRTTSGLVQAGPVTVVDTFHDWKWVKGADIFEDFRRNMGEERLKSITILRGDSHKVLPGLKGPYRLILVDADHSPDAAYRDICDCMPLLCDGGYLYVDDFNWLDVQEACARAMGEGVIPRGKLASRKLAYFIKGDRDGLP